MDTRCGNTLHDQYKLINLTQYTSRVFKSKLRTMEWIRGSVRDETGTGFDTVTSGELVLPAKFDVDGLNGQLKAVRELPYQQGDILICNYGKTGE